MRGEWSKKNRPALCLYKPPGNKCLICGNAVSTGFRFKGWSWWVRSSDRRVIGIIHDACLEEGLKN